MSNEAGSWQWKNGSTWQEFDSTASDEIDQEIRNKCNQPGDNTLTYTFTLTKGPWFSLSKNKGVYTYMKVNSFHSLYHNRS